jgi:hypothetical protein
MTEWTTRLDPAYTAQFGAGELHASIFHHKDDAAKENGIVTFSIPETPKDTLAQGLSYAKAERYRVMFVCDTAKQAEACAMLMAEALPDHNRVALERAEAGALAS